MRTVSVANDALLSEVARMLSKGKDIVLRTKGNSMLPFVVGGKDSVVLRQKETYTVGDIVLAEVAPGKFVLHRVIKTDGERITLMGDGNLYGTESCLPKDICGHAVAIVRNGKHRKIGRGRLWQMLLPVRKYLLAIYRRL